MESPSQKFILANISRTLRTASPKYAAISRSHDMYGNSENAAHIVRRIFSTARSAQANCIIAPSVCFPLPA